ncbi:MAG: UDP-3-O-(3-hydroxymyristoyl)glucosamine N-acyltransferase [Bacteroidia bacterium]|nr:UDP-3-O-(3-hydroxymyristoyl)glucosamine N-acyltransferase [Bacteroidia bacterium]
MKLSQSVSLREAALILGCRFVGDPDHLITGCNEIHRVEPGDMTFVDVEKYYQKALTSLATTVLINKETEVPVGKGLLISDNPFTDYNRFAAHFQPILPVTAEGQPFLGRNVSIGRNVVFGQDVVIGDDVTIGHNTVIGSGVSIGRGTILYPQVTIGDYTQIGEEVCIQAGSVIGGEAFYFKTRPWGREKLVTQGRVVIGSHVDIGAGCTIDRGVSADTIIGDWTKIDNLVQIGHDTVIGKRCLIAAQVGVAGVVNIEDDVILWGQVGVNKDLTIGKGAVLMGKTGVMSSLEGGKTYLGMIATEARQTLREVAALRRLPELLRKWTGKDIS